MGSWVLLTVAFVSALVGLSQSCSPCPFQWMENGNYCYRFFPEDLSYNEAEMFCKQFSHTGHVAELATVSTLEELTFIMGYLDNVYVNVPAANIPMNVWLMNITQNIPGKCLQFFKLFLRLHSIIESVDYFNESTLNCRFVTDWSTCKLLSFQTGR